MRVGPTVGVAVEVEVGVSVGVGVAVGVGVSVGVGVAVGVSVGVGDGEASNMGAIGVCCGSSFANQQAEVPTTKTSRTQTNVLLIIGTHLSANKTRTGLSTSPSTTFTIPQVPLVFLAGNLN